jgi:hypothetical protein
MLTRLAVEPATVAPRLRSGSRSHRSIAPPGTRAVGAVALTTVGLAVLFVIVARVRPAYDAYGWLVWGRQAAHLRLNTTAAPSWKPLSFLFTFPYALVFGRSAVWLWMVTATAAGFAAPLLGGHVAWRLSGESSAPRPARLVGGLVGGGAILGIWGGWHFLLISYADPMMVALALGVIDCLLAGRRRTAWGLLVLLCLGRPEAVPILLGLAVYWGRRQPAMRWLLGAGVVAIPLLWFGVPALTSPSWLNAARVLDTSTSPLSGNKLWAILEGLATLYELPMQLAVGAALLLAVVLRQRTWLLMLGAAVVWLLGDLALALHGDGVAPRYMLEPAAVLLVLPAAAVGRLLSGEPAGARVLRWVAVAALLALGAGLVTPARLRARLMHNGIGLGQTWARQIGRLHRVVSAEGAARIIACGQPVAPLAFQSILAWELDRNVADVGWRPGAAVRSGVPIVLFTPWHAGFIVQAIHTDPARAAACRRLDRTTPTG